MKKNWFLPTTTDMRVAWLNNFAAKLPAYADRYDITTADVEDTQLGAAYYEYCVVYKHSLKQYNKKMPAWLKEIEFGKKESVLGQAPVFDPPPAPAVGILSRATYIGARIKGHKDYAESDGRDMGLEGTISVSKSASEIKPVLKVVRGIGGHPLLKWRKRLMHGIEIWKDSGDGEWKLLDVDLQPDYLDESPLPVNGAALWRYKAIYRLDSQQYGLWSEVVSIAVGG